MKKTPHTPECEWEPGDSGGVTYACTFKRHLILKISENKISNR